MMALGWSTLVALLDRNERVDAVCPLCGPWRKPAHQKLKTLRVWRAAEDFVTYKCIHCDESGYGFPDDDRARRPNMTAAAPGRDVARAKAALAHDVDLKRRRDRALDLWQASIPLKNTYGEIFVHSRLPLPSFGITLPATLRYLPAGVLHDGHALICAHGIPTEPAPGVLEMPSHRIMAVQVNFLNADGTQRADIEVPRRSYGSMIGNPLVLAPMNDALGLCIGEGLFKVWAHHLLTGLGAWVSGGASFLPYLAQSVPGYVDSITLLQDNNEAGRVASARLHANLHDRFRNSRNPEKSFDIRIAQQGQDELAIGTT